jgi:glycosyltransferase involved in cell wall biosynthesis
VLDQSLSASEFKVYDNCSTDDSVAVARGLLPEDDVVVAGENLGAARNFRRAMNEASPDARYFMWLAADDRIEPTFLARCVERLESDLLAPACLSGIQFIDPDGRPLRTHQDLDLASADLAVRCRSFLRRTRWTEFYCVYRKESLEASPGITSMFGSDVHLTWWFLLRAPLAVLAEPLLLYREYPQKSVAEMAESLTPGAEPPRWAKAKLWRHLWAMTLELDRPARTVARRELLRALGSAAWRIHLSEDVMTRWPTAGRAARRLARIARKH